MRRIVQQAGTRMVVYLFEKALVAHPIMEVFTGMDFIAHIYAMLVKHVQYRPPACRRLRRPRTHEPVWPLRPGAYRMRRWCATERSTSIRPRVGRSVCCVLHLLHGPLLPCFRCIMVLLRCKSGDLGVGWR